MPNNNSDIISAIKEWASPMLIAIVGTLLWSDLSELKTDVKTLLIQQSENATRIELLEKDVQILKQNKTAGSKPLSSLTYVQQIEIAAAVGLPLWMRIGPFKKEDEIRLEEYSLA
jgi:hypothetical protein